MAKRHEYTGGAWSIGSVRPYRPPATLTALEAAARAREIRDHWLPIAQERAAQGRRWYPGMVAWYERELHALDAVSAAQTAQKPRAQRGKVAA